MKIFQPTITGSFIVTGSIIITGSLIASSGITGSLSGTTTTSSYVTGSIFNSTNPALSASYALTASYITGSIHNSTNPALSASYALTASYAMNAGGGGGGAGFPYTGDASISGSLTLTGSATTAAPLHVLSGSTSLLYVSSSGNVGIGKSVPISKIDAVSTASFGSAYSLVHLQTSLNAGDVGDACVKMDYTLSGSGAGTELVTRTLNLYSTNAWTTGTVSNARIFNLASLTNASTNTTNLDQVYLENVSNGTVTNFRAIHIANSQGTSQGGLVIAQLTGTNRAGVSIGSSTLPSGVWSIYSSTSDKSYHAGNFLIGTNSDSGYKLDVNGTTQLNGNITTGLASTFILPGATTGTNARIQIGSVNSFFLTNTDGSYRSIVALTPNGAASGYYSWFFDYETNRGLLFGAGNTANTSQIIRAGITIASLTNTAGAETGDLTFSTKPASSAMVERLRLYNDSRALFTSAYTATVSSQSYFQIAGNITQVQTASAQIYGVNITPTMIYTTGSQTQTALRVAPTFSGSAAFSSSQQNIIADFGATSVGTQFSVNDITSGSIYMVNDVSGLPIIEALSDWTVNMYNYPTKVFQKSGSVITISGSLVVSPSSSFVLPLTASASPAVGSAYWSGSFLFIYNGTRYMSSSFA